ncbi:MAG: hypothetical protein IJP23_05290 [Oscillospiraceae bacterium]|nr:hypothetical protein [Oscillospiraceae bacterium]
MADFEIITKKGERMIVLYPGCPAEQAAKLRGHYKIALVPEALSETGPWALTAGSFISYGPGRRNHISVSSISADKIMAAVERELPVLGGGVIERQEVELGNAGDAAPEQLLASLGRDLLSGALS